MTGRRYGAGMTDVATEPTAVPKPQGRGKIYISGAVILAVTAGAAAIWFAVLGPLLSPADVTIHGDLNITRPARDWVRTNNPCVGDGGGGYDDVHEGTQVVISDADGTTIAVGALGVGVPVGLASIDKPASCKFPFEVVAPGGHDFYGVAVGKRGTVQYPVARLTQPLRLTLD